MSSLNKVILLGIDGATPGLLLPWAREGKLPNLARVLADGTHGTLQSTLPPYSASAWVSMMTGRHPSKHGVLDFFSQEAGPGRHEFISSATVRGEAIWHTLGRHGISTGMVNIPLTYPPSAVNGYMVSGFMTPKGRQDYTYPNELREEIIGVTGEYDPDPWDLMAPEQDLQSFLHWMRITEKVAIHLHDHHRVAFYSSVIQALDQLQHGFWDVLADERAHSTAAGSRAWPALQECFALMDQAIGQRLSWMDANTTLFLASDHGFQPARRWFFVNRWLRQQGLLQTMTGQRTLGQSLAARLGISRESVRRLVQRMDPFGLRRVLGRFARASIADKLDDSLSLPVDWARSRAYSGSRTSEGIYINMIGREPNGIVKAGSEYEELRTQIVRALQDFVDEDTGQTVVSGAFRRDEVYPSGEFVSQLPDILLAFEDKPYLVNESTSPGPITAPILGGDLTGRHHPMGLFAAVGSSIRGNYTVQDARIVDVMPTILYAMGLPIPKDCDGRVLEEIFTPEYRRTHTVVCEETEHALDATEDRGGAYTESEEAEMQRRLRALGYMD